MSPRWLNFLIVVACRGNYLSTPWSEFRFYAYLMFLCKQAGSIDLKGIAFRTDVLCSQHTTPSRLCFYYLPGYGPIGISSKEPREPPEFRPFSSTLHTTIIRHLLLSSTVSQPPSSVTVEEE